MRLPMISSGADRKREREWESNMKRAQNTEKFFYCKEKEESRRWQWCHGWEWAAGISSNQDITDSWISHTLLHTTSAIIELDYEMGNFNSTFYLFLCFIYTDLVLLFIFEPTIHYNLGHKALKKVI